MEPSKVIVKSGPQKPKLENVTLAQSSVANNASCIKLGDPVQTATETQISVGCILLVVEN